ncbi:glycosyltransferase family 9 protein [Peterkaempfera bronchialis]|uniref:glycosyltransferase family 9 protein n=1 Tax=Peterkaempfera bronchialis TaxID=2126346 RepID=UPI003C30AC75
MLRALGLGDLLTAVPALRALRRAHPGREIVLAAPARLAEAAAATGAVDRVLPAEAPGRGVPERLDWTGPPPETAVDLHGNGPPSRQLLQRLQPGRLLAFAHPDTPDSPDTPGTPDTPTGRAPQWRDDEHERIRWCRLLTWYGIPADPDDLRITAPGPASPAPDAIVLHPGADAGARRWPAARFAEVAAALTARGRRVVVTAGPGEAQLARQVADLAGLPAAQVLGAPGGLTFGGLAAVLAQARALVVGDTGPAHLATALGTPSVVLFGPVAPRLWGPPALTRHRALWHPDPGSPLRPGDAHGRRPDRRLLRITPAEVLDALDALPAPAAAWRPRPGPPGGGV